MNRRLLLAEEALENLLGASGGATMNGLIERLQGSPDFDEAEIRAAVWTLVSSGRAELDKDVVHLPPVEAAVAAA